MAAAAAANVVKRSILPSYDRFMTAKALSRQPSAIRALMPLLSIPGMIPLSGGMPNPATFPFKSMTLTTTDGDTIPLDGAEFAAALQYSATDGLPSLLSWLRKLQEHEHKRDLEGMQMCVTVGSQDGLSKAFDMFAAKDDTLLVENPTYSGSLAYLRPIGCKLISVNTDQDGLNTDDLEEKLTHWAPDLPRPKALYTIPIGQNPSGTSMSIARRHKLLELAEKFDFIIMEDDPYYYLQYSEKRLPSLFSMDTTGRVLRFDSFSKVLSSGLRLGFVTGPQPLVQRIILHTQASNLHASGLSQAVVAALLNKWGLEGWEAHVQKVRRLYVDRCDQFLGFAEKHLKGLAEWSRPTAGMFTWFKLLGVEDSGVLIRQKAVEKKVLLVPGQEFIPAGTKCPYVRASFSVTEPAKLEEALKRLGELLRDNAKAQQAGAAGWCARAARVRW